MSWPMVALGELMAVRTPSLDPAKYPDEEFELWSIPAFDAGAPETALGVEIGSAKKVVEPNDVLLSRIVPHIRRSWVVASPSARKRQIASGEWIIFRSERVHPPYLRHVLQGDTFHTAFMGTVAGVGGSLLRARPEAVKRIQIPLPPLPEQQRIAAILDQADALRRLAANAVENFDEILSADYYRRFGDPASNNMKWPTSELADILEEIEGGWSPVCLDRAASAGEWGVLKLGAVTYGRYNPAANKALPSSLAPRRELEVQKGDILFSRKNTYDLVGASVLVTETAENLLIPDLIFRLKLKSQGKLFAPEFLQTTLAVNSMRTLIKSLASGAAGSMPNISKARLRNLRIPRPPIDEQLRYATFRIMHEVQRSAMMTRSSNIDSLFASLQHRAFRGEL